MVRVLAAPCYWYRKYLSLILLYACLVSKLYIWIRALVSIRSLEYLLIKFLIDRIGQTHTTTIWVIGHQFVTTNLGQCLL